MDKLYCEVENKEISFCRTKSLLIQEEKFAMNYYKNNVCLFNSLPKKATINSLKVINKMSLNIPATESELPTTGQEAVTPSARVIPPAPTGEVKGKGLDIGILIDSSFGLSPDEFEQLKQFISQLIFSINMHFTNVHFGIIVYSDLPDLVITLQNVDQLDVVSVIDGVKYLPGGHRTDLAMLYASRKLFCPEGCEDRLEEENVLIVFSSENTDAESLPYSFIRPIMKVSRNVKYNKRK